MTLSAGTRLGPYELVGALGAGGMGEVYRAVDTRLGRTVAVKVLPASAADDPDRHRRFEQEARAVSALNHPHICTLYDVGREGDTDFLVMEFVEGETLASRVRRGPLPVDEVVDLGLQLAEALGVAHERGLVHRDIKPSNLMVTADGSLKILDFGLAKRREPISDDATTQVAGPGWARTEPGALVGTPAYMAPEQIAGGVVSPATDVYAAGCVLYELLVGRAPFAGPDVVGMLRRTLTETAPPLSESRQDVPEGLSTAVARALACEPQDRYANGRELARALSAVRSAATEGVPVSVPVTQSDATRPAGQAATSGRAEARVSAVQPHRLLAVLERVSKRRLVAGLLGIVLVAALAWVLATRFTQPALAFKERDFVLVADVVNTTGEPVFDLALKSALETDLRQSRYVNVLDSSQVQNALALMRLKPDTPLTLATGRDICRRVGARALLVPRILRAGEAYQLTVSLIEPATGRVAAEVQVTVRGREQVLLSAIDNLTREVRRRLGESLGSIARTDPPFVQYTTSSLEALNLLVLGQRGWEAGDFAKAERYFNEALQRDPRFATARGSLGLLYIQFLNRADDGKKLLALALQEEGAVSQREYLALRAVNRQFVMGDLQGALDDYRFLADLYPDFMPAYNNSGRILAAMGRYREAATMYERAYKAESRSSTPLWNLWFLCVQRLKDPLLAERTARKLMELYPEDANATQTLAWSFVAERRFAEAEETSRRAASINPSHDYALPNLAHLLFRRGALAEAVATYREVLKQAAAGRLRTDIDDVYLCLGLALAANGDRPEARRTFLKGIANVRARGRQTRLTAEDDAKLSALLAAAGRDDEARSFAERIGSAPDGSGITSYRLAEAYALLGDRARALDCLERAFAAGYEDTYLLLIDPPLATLQDDPAIERLAPRKAG